MPVEKLLDFDSSFIRGSNSSMEPTQLPIGYLWDCINMIIVAGVPSCRPGYRCIAQMPRGNLQGCAIFRPLLGMEQIMIAIDGVIHVATFPFTEFKTLPNVLFSSTAKQVFFKQAIQSAQRNTPGSLSSAITVIPPRAVMMMQDGGTTAPAFYDGANSGHIRDVAFQTPAGGAMEWVGDRLWVAVGPRVFASDIVNPFSFVEQIYLGGTSSFNFSRDVTAMVRTPSLSFPQLMVYTDEATTLIQANIRNRNLWPTTDGMQQEILQVGCAGNRAVTSQFGRLVWFSNSGVVFFDPATAQGWTSRSPLRDNEMLTSKTLLSSDVSLTAMGAFGQFLMISLPVEDVYNKHTWVLNSASWETITDQGGPTWNGYWLGTRPVEWAYGVIAGAERIYHVSFDADRENRLWECFIPDRLDNGCPIMWAAFTRGYFGLTGQSKKAPGMPCQFMFADVALAGLDEDLDIGAFLAPGDRGSFKQIMSKRVTAEQGSLVFNREVTATTQVFAYKAQSRILRTEDFRQQEPTEESGSCPVESEANDGVEESFQMLIVGHGPATIRWIRPFALADPEQFSGEPKACENEPPFNIVRFDGEAAHNEDVSVAALELEQRAVANYRANKTVSMTVDSITAVGVGFSESIIAQQAADRVAEIIATRQAETEIGVALPSILSIGKGFDE